MSNLIPEDWLPYARMKRIHVHWTAGSYNASSLDKKHYHFILEGDGTLVKGNPSVKDNEPPLRSGRYAAHTWHANSRAIAVSMAAMANAKENPFDAGRYPLTEEQWKAMINVVAQLCDTYHIPVTSTTVLTHAEVQPNLGIRQRGKWDITRLPWDDSVRGYKAVGDLMRNQVRIALGEPESDDNISDWPKECEVTVDSLNVRLGARMGSKIVDVVDEGDILEATGVYWNGPTEWWSVNTPGKAAGWVAARFVKDLEDELDT